MGQSQNYKWLSTINMMMVYGCVRVNPLGLNRKEALFMGSICTSIFYLIQLNPIWIPLNLTPEKTVKCHINVQLLACQCAQNINRVNWFGNCYKSRPHHKRALEIAGLFRFTWISFNLYQFPFWENYVYFNFW